MSNEWYALHVKPHKERIVTEQLSSAMDMTVFFPHVMVKPKNPRSSKIRAFFPGYLFVRTDLAVLGDNAFQWTPGVHGLVKVGGMPAIVPASLITELRLRLQAIQREGGLQYSGLHEGDRVRVVSGPFAGYEAIFDARLNGTDRIQVLLSFLSHHPQPVKLHIDDIRKIEPRNTQ
jgi:transcriptional antiterminator RfaH